ncbi:hypothetical protein RJ639_002272 [Escallonia herrerae]|uniref:Desiccation-related protein PCC13-62 n=1 Tax=Escallonia herrerae TaxID=1293975 RepID=A0AA88X979_9ASTE|nr:hypothetical protein RJ639_002272 [Escallonia herrerae]
MCLQSISLITPSLFYLSLSTSKNTNKRTTMANISASTCFVTLVIVLISSKLMHTCFSSPTCPPGYPEQAIPIYKEDIDMMQFAENLEHLEADFFLWSALGYGLDQVAPSLVMGGPSPIGAQKANLDALTQHIIEEFGYEEVGHLRTFVLRPYHCDNNDPFCTFALQLLAGLLGSTPYTSEAGQDAVIRSYLYERAKEVVHPYNHTVAEFTIQISEIRNRLAMCGIKDEGIIGPLELGAENRTITNVLSANYYSLSYMRTLQEILRIVYGTGDKHVPRGFYPHGGNGRIAREFLEKS